MSRAADPCRTVRQFLVTSLVFACLLLLARSGAFAQTCEDNCNSDYGGCTSSCDTQYYDCAYSTPGYYCDSDRQNCYSSCDSSLNSCTAGCGSSGGGGTPPGDGHVWCDGWDRQGDCAFNHIGVAAGAEFRRFRGGGGYVGQTFLTWHPAEFDGFGRFSVADGNVGIISTSPEPGQVPLHRWSTRKGFYYSIYYYEHGGDYVYGGIAGYVWPPSSNQGYPLYQFYSDEYGHFYTNYPRDIYCQPAVRWAVQGAMARVNWPAPFFQANRICYNNQSLGVPGSCDPFAMARCRARGSVYNTGNCSCFDGLP
jgi:hypothetical protein